VEQHLPHCLLSNPHALCRRAAAPPPPKAGQVSRHNLVPLALYRNLGRLVGPPDTLAWNSRRKVQATNLPLRVNRSLRPDRSAPVGHASTARLTRASLDATVLRYTKLGMIVILLAFHENHGSR
jgi:hypothetical protein